MLSGRHPKKDVQAAIEAILADAWWRLERAKRGGHVWGVLKCGYERRGGCIVRINSTPQNPGNHARRLLQEVSACRHRGR